MSFGNFFRDDLDNREVMVSVKCLTYNHVKYITQALDGFLLQKTNFRFEVIVHDDASTDGTATILKEYSKKFPSIIKPVFEKENQYKKNYFGLIKKMDDYMRGKYIALCEGDDYWTDPYKLQKQVDFLEANPDYSMCFHNALVHWENGSKPDALLCDLEEREYSEKELFNRYLSQTATLIFRSNLYKTDLYNRMKTVSLRDIAIISMNAHIGKVHCIPTPMSVYRKHCGGITAEGDLTIDIVNNIWKIAEVIGSPLTNNKTKFFTTGYLYSFENAVRRRNLREALRCIKKSFQVSIIRSFISFIGMHFNIKGFFISLTKK